MNRRIATWATIVIAAFGLTACSGAPAAPETPTGGASSAPSTPVEQTPAPETTPAAGGEDSLTQACFEPSAKLAEAATELQKVGEALSQSEGKDPQETIDALRAVADAFGEIAEETTHPDVKEALTSMQATYNKLADLLTKVLIDQDASAAAELGPIMTELQESIAKFQELCA